MEIKKEATQDLLDDMPDRGQTDEYIKWARRAIEAAVSGTVVKGGVAKALHVSEGRLSRRCCEDRRLAVPCLRCLVVVLRGEGGPCACRLRVSLRRGR